MNSFSIPNKYGYVLLIFVFLIEQINTYDDLPRDEKFENVLHNSLKCFRQNLEKDNSFQEEMYFSEGECEYIDGYIHLRKNLVNGLTSFYAPDIKWIPISDTENYFNITLGFEHFFFKTLYDCDYQLKLHYFILNIFSFKERLFGNGHILLNIEDFSINVNGIINIDDEITIDDLSVILRVGYFHIDVTGLKDDELISLYVSNFINLFISKWFNAGTDIVDKLISQYIQVYLNLILTIAPKDTFEYFKDAFNCILEISE